MTDLPVYYGNPDQVIPVPVEFIGTPGTIVLTVTDPTGTATVYSGGQVISEGGNKYKVLVQQNPLPAGLWTCTWTGIGGSAANDAEIYVSTFRVIALTDTGTGMVSWYCSMEELKSRLQIDQSDTDDDYEIQLVLQTVTDWITGYCGRHFYQVTEERTYRPDNVWAMPIDDIVTCTSVDLDYDGDQVYEVHWVENRDYQLLRYPSNYNLNNLGVPRPRNQLQVLMASAGSPSGGQWLPWLWPFTAQNRVKITGTWGWPSVPPNVTQAALYIAAEMFKAKDSPFGVAGISDLGLIKIQASPWVGELLRLYKNPRNTVGV